MIEMNINPQHLSGMPIHVRNIPGLIDVLINIWSTLPYRANNKLCSWTNTLFQNQHYHTVPITNCVHGQTHFFKIIGFGANVSFSPFPSPLILLFCSHPNFLDELAQKCLICWLALSVSFCFCYVFCVMAAFKILRFWKIICGYH